MVNKSSYSQGSQKGFAPILLLLLGLIVGGVVVYGVMTMNSIPSNEVTPVATNISTSTPVPQVKAGWTTYSGDDYSFQYPLAETKTDTGAAGTGFESFRVIYMGEKQRASGRTETSLADGYMFIVTKIQTDGSKTISELAAERRGNSVQGCLDDAQVGAIKEVDVGNQKGLQYSVDNCLGDYTNTYVGVDKAVYEITQMFTGEEPEYFEYKKITEEIFSTLKFK